MSPSLPVTASTLDGWVLLPAPLRLTCTSPKFILRFFELTHCGEDEERFNPAPGFGSLSISLTRDANRNFWMIAMSIWHLLVDITTEWHLVYRVAHKQERAQLQNNLASSFCRGEDSGCTLNADYHAYFEFFGRTFYAFELSRTARG